MSKEAKTINLYLIDGEFDGRIKCYIANRTVIACKIPKSMLDFSNEIKYINNSGIYLLFGYKEYEKVYNVYVGQAGVRKNGQGILKRIKEHEKEDYWSEAVIFTTSNNSFGATEINYLENKFFNIFKNSKGYILKNENEPTQGNITEEKEHELEEYSDNYKLMINALGYKLFRINKKENKFYMDNDEILYFKTKKANAKGKKISNGFLIFAGSTLSLDILKSCPKGIIEKRNKYKKNIDSNGKIDIDIEFKSSSAAAKFISGSSVSGNESWKYKNGIKLGDCINKKEFNNG